MTTQDEQSKEMRRFATNVVRELEHAGFVAYFAGGCVRDSLLNRLPKDFDVATNARPEQVRQVFGARRTLAIGASFGVMTVLGPKPHQVEVATFRNDGEYTDGRHPDGVTYSTAEEDASRRDFTVNGMFFDPIENRIIDYVGGEIDLAAKLIRAIGDPDARIEEDRLRMLRAVRFAATYDFSIENQTLSAIQAHAAKITVVSQERITAEIRRMLGNENRTQALKLMHESGLLEFVLPPLIPLVESRDRWPRLLHLVSNPSISTFPQVVVLLLGAEGVNMSPSTADEFCRGLKLSNEQRQCIVWTLSNLTQLERAHTCKFSEIQPLLTEDCIHDALAVLRAVADDDESRQDAIRHCETLLSREPSELDPPVLIRGNDLMGLGMQAGPQFKETLDAVRVAQLDGLLNNESEAIEYVKRMLDLR